MKNRIFKSVFVAAIILISVFMQSCSSSTTGANEDKIKPVVTLLRVTDDNNIDNEIIGVATIQWISRRWRPRSSPCGSATAWPRRSGPSACG